MGPASYTFGCEDMLIERVSFWVKLIAIGSVIGVSISNHERSPQLAFIKKY